MLYMIWSHLNNLKNVKNTPEGVLLLVKLQSSASNFTKSNTSPWVFFTFFKLYKWYQIAQSVSYNTHMIMMNSFGEMVDRRKALSLVYSQDHCQTFSPPQISDTPHTGFIPRQHRHISIAHGS